jgi:AcrR family transcriptional regulator
MKKQSVREKYRQEVRAAILRAAQTAFLQGGFGSVSMRGLAAKIGYSHGSIYRHFKSKEQLFDCLVEESFAQLARALQGLKLGRRTEDPGRLLKRAARAYVDFGLRNPGAYEFAFILRRPGRPRPWKPHLAYEYLQNLVGRCVAGKHGRPRDVEAASQAVWAAVHGVTSLLILRPWLPWVDKEKLIRRVIASAVDGLVAGPRPTGGSGQDPVAAGDGNPSGTGQRVGFSGQHPPAHKGTRASRTSASAGG